MGVPQRRPGKVRTSASSYAGIILTVSFVAAIKRLTPFMRPSEDNNADAQAPEQEIHEEDERSPLRRSTRTCVHRPYDDGATPT